MNEQCDINKKPMKARVFQRAGSLITAPCLEAPTVARREGGGRSAGWRMGVKCHNRCSLPSFYSPHCVPRDGTALLAWWQTLTTCLSPWALSTTGVVSAPGLLLFSDYPGWETQ